MKHLFPLVLAGGLCASASFVQASPIEFYTNIPATGSVNGNLDFDGSADGGYRSVDITNASPFRHYNGLGGQFQGYFSTGPLASDPTANPANLYMRFLCIDIYSFASESVIVYSADRYQNTKLAKLFDIAYPNKQLGDYFNEATNSISAFGQFADGGGYLKQDYSAAFQLATWELFYETNASHNLGTGAFTNALTSSAAHTLANQWLAQVDNYTGSGYQEWQLYRFTSTTNQDYLSARYIPEPGSLALLGLGLAGLGLARMRRQRA